MRPLLFPDDWTGEQALAFSDFLYRLADEILRHYDAPIRIHLREIDEMRPYKPDFRQLRLPFVSSFDDLPF